MSSADAVEPSADAAGHPAGPAEPGAEDTEPVPALAIHRLVAGYGDVPSSAAST
jgi:hypothetical protein